MVFIDGENFLFSIRKLYRAEFDRGDYLPRNASWGWFFGKIAQELNASEFSVRWYVINELDYHPHADWIHEPWETLMEKFRDEAILEELGRKTTIKGKRRAVENLRNLCQEAQQVMQSRLAEWHGMQDAISAEHPFVKFYRPGWQPCFLPDRRLGREKGVDIGLAVDLIHQLPNYDLAVLFSGDGDYVPAIDIGKTYGKEIALMEFEFRTGEALRGTSRRLRGRADTIINVPFQDLATFLGIQLGADGNLLAVD
jgi:uncharacterized LabA/DUF88 family protein